jgi:hypothetical protein
MQEEKQTFEGAASRCSAQKELQKGGKTNAKIAQNAISGAADSNQEILVEILTLFG